MAWHPGSGPPVPGTGVCTEPWRRCKQASEQARPVISGAELQVIVGHLTVRAVLHRGLMRITRHVYSFIEVSYSKRTRLWASVAKELWLFQHLMVLGVNRTSLRWDSELLCTDACLSGYAVLERDQSVEEVATHSR